MHDWAWSPSRRRAQQLGNVNNLAAGWGWQYCRLLVLLLLLWGWQVARWGQARGGWGHSLCRP